ncbi:uncharacterized protein EMH_0000180 [Eimeria mitis]|uniref:Uncharacterized protein n=1 Tax=Eimeria mitis TaxID=44415 RepID=U6KK01_9EIME|nr:uncharacterized protein EMH_0000180 [Eimeria mitis]CDJ35783.1 hypothetical protein EMH_0000180 [Eimeria mitis]
MSHGSCLQVTLRSQGHAREDIQACIGAGSGLSLAGRCKVWRWFERPSPVLDGFSFLPVVAICRAGVKARESGTVLKAEGRAGIG